VPLLIWHLGPGNVAHHELSYRARSGEDRAFDAWVRRRRRHFAAVVVNGDYVRGGSIGLALSVDRSDGEGSVHYNGKALFDCVQNRYVFLQFGRRI
jgi:hypothetical protein